MTDADGHTITKYRVKDTTGATHIVLENNQKVILPPTITKVPALLLLNHSHHVLFGERIYNHLQPAQAKETTTATFGNEEPMAYGINQMNSMTVDIVIGTNHQTIFRQKVVEDYVKCIIM